MPLKKHILVFTAYFWPEQFVINDFVRLLKGRGYTIDVVTQNPSYPLGRTFKEYGNPWFSKEVEDGITIYRFKSVLGYKNSVFYKIFAYLFFVFWGSFFLLTLYRNVPAGLFVYHIGPLTMAVPALLLARIRRLPSTIWTQDIWPDAVFAYGFRRTAWLETILGIFSGAVYRCFDKIVVSSEGFIPTLETFARQPISVVHNWPLQCFDIPRSDPSTIPVFMFAGNIGKFQNLENVIRGYAVAIKNHGCFCKLVLVGDGSNLPRIMALSSELSAAVDFTGRVPASEMAKQYERADVLLLSIIDSNAVGKTIPSKFQAYLNVGRPIFAVGPKELRSVIESEKLGLGAAANDIEDIADGFWRLAQALPLMYHSWCDNSRSLFLRRFSPSTLMDRLETLLATHRL